MSLYDRQEIEERRSDPGGQGQEVISRHEETVRTVGGELVSVEGLEDDGERPGPKGDLDVERYLDSKSSPPETMETVARDLMDLGVIRSVPVKVILHNDGRRDLEMGHHYDPQTQTLGVSVSPTGPPVQGLGGAIASYLRHLRLLMRSPQTGRQIRGYLQVLLLALLLGGLVFVAGVIL